MDQLQILYIAKACHEANRVWCQANDDNTAISGVEFKMNNPNAGEDAQHNAWMEEKIKAGWIYGDTKDAERKTHPCIVPFDQLPEFQRKKDVLFCAIVDALK